MKMNTVSVARNSKMIPRASLRVESSVAVWGCGGGEVACDEWQEFPYLEGGCHIWKAAVGCGRRMREVDVGGAVAAGVV